MKKDIHPKYYPEAKVICACGNTWTTGSTQPEVRTEMCSACHPFFTGEQRIVDTAGQVERFERRRKIAEQIQDEQKVRDAERKEQRGSIFELVAEEAAPEEGALTKEQAAAMAEAMLGPTPAEAPQAEQPERPSRRARRPGAQRAAKAEAEAKPEAGAVPAAEEKPKRRRAKKAAVEAKAGAKPEAEAVPAAEEKPKRRRTRKAAAEAKGEAETVAEKEAISASEQPKAEADTPETEAPTEPTGETSE